MAKEKVFAKYHPADPPGGWETVAASVERFLKSLGLALWESEDFSQQIHVVSFAPPPQTTKCIHSNLAWKGGYTRNQ